MASSHLLLGSILIVNNKDKASKETEITKRNTIKNPQLTGSRPPISIRDHTNSINETNFNSGAQIFLEKEDMTRNRKIGNPTNDI